MTKDYEHKGNQYWITVEPALNTLTSKTNFIAYVSDSEPNGLLFGVVVKNPDQSVMEFESELAAFTNANAIKQSEIDSKQN